MVTEFDRAVGAADRRRPARRARPTTAIVGEEGTDRAGTSGVRWFIDPIDGTTNFLYGLPGCAVSIAAGDDARHAGRRGVRARRTDELFAAARGGGRDAATARRSACADDRRSLRTRSSATGFSYARRAAPRPGRARRHAHRPRARHPPLRGSAALDLCYVAAGRVDAYYEQLARPWDIAAGELIAARGRLPHRRDFDGGPVRPDERARGRPGAVRRHAWRCSTAPTDGRSRRHRGR